MSILKVNNIVAYSGTHVSGTFSGVFSGSFDSSRIDALEAFSSSLDSTFATDLVVNSLSGAFNSFTAALDNTYATDTQLLPILQATRSIELTTGSLIGITNGLMAFTAALDSTYATDAQLYQLYAETASIKAEIAEIEAYTASLKAATIVSSSTQIQNYNVFAQTASVNTFYGNQTISGSVLLSGSIKFNDGTTQTTAFVGGGTANTNQNSFYINESGSFINYSNFTASYQPAGAPPLNFQIGYQHPITTETGINVLAVGFPDGTIQTTAFNTGSFATTGSNTFIGNQTITGSLRIEDDNNFSKINGFKFSLANATPNLIGNLDSVGIYAGYDIENDITTSLASNRIFYITVGENSNYWTFGRDGILTVPGNIAGAHNLAITGSNTFIGNQTITGSLNVTGSVNIDNVIKLTPVTSFPSGQAGMLIASASYGKTNLYMYDGSDWKWLVTGSIA